MKKTDRVRHVAEETPEYDARRGVRGRYADLSRQDRPDSTGSVLHAWAPLVGFRWTGAQWRLAEDTHIEPGHAFAGHEEHQAFKYFLSEEERDRCRALGHWLHLTHQRSDALSIKSKMNSFLLALWIVRPTKTHLPFRLETAGPTVQSANRVLDRFQWIKGHVEESIADSDLRRVSALLKPLRALYVVDGRLKAALALTFRGCVASEWQSAFISMAAAMEAMLIYSKHGVGDQLANSYATLVATPRSLTSDAARFRRLYGVRSSIIHGRSHAFDDPSRNIEDLAEFSNVLRRLWRVVLKSPRIQKALEQDDEQRKRFFASYTGSSVDKNTAPFPL